MKNRIKEIRKPIEKELKDFVKIAKWNDINYWSVKETVEKTHRTLHKFMRKFEVRNHRLNPYKKPHFFDGIMPED